MFTISIMNNYFEVVLYGQHYKNGKSYIKNVKSDFDIIRELELDKLHKKSIYINVIVI